MYEYIFAIPNNPSLQIGPNYLHQLIESKVSVISLMKFFFSIQTLVYIVHLLLRKLNFSKFLDDKILVLEGTELNLNCLHNGSNIKWILPDQSTSSVNPLVIPDMDSENDQGIYECTTSNSLGKLFLFFDMFIRPITCYSNF